MIARVAGLVPALLALAACNASRAAPPPGTGDAVAPAVTAPAALAPAALCATRGALGADPLAVTVTDAVFRAVAPAAAGDAVELAFTVQGPTADTVALASGQIRRQVGLKLRAADGCNLIYVMWRSAPKPGLVVSVKQNPGQHDHAACGVRGYRDLAPTRAGKLPALHPDAPHVLRAAITGDTLVAWIDEREVWRGRLDAAARRLAGPPGVRSDNLAFTGAVRAVPATDRAAATTAAACAASD